MTGLGAVGEVAGAAGLAGEAAAGLGAAGEAGALAAGAGEAAGLGAAAGEGGLLSEIGGIASRGMDVIDLFGGFGGGGGNQNGGGLGGLLQTMTGMFPPGFGMVQQAVGGIGNTLGCGGGMSPNDVANAQNPEELDNVVGGYRPPEGIYNDDQMDQINQSQQGFLGMGGQYDGVAQLIPQLLGMLEQTGHGNVKIEFDLAQERENQNRGNENEYDNEQEYSNEQEYDVDNEEQELRGRM
ncbi:hypothetical protein HDU97_002897 [Phlyctochytrium planicorne]|nr:hypothetical protein HDU97_002897 [Phlyctochytrium planicorne]